MSSEIPASHQPRQVGTFRLRRLLQKWPFLIWAGMLGLVVLMYLQRGSYGRVNGMVAAAVEDVAPPEDGVVLKVHVKEGDVVTEGQTLVTLDPTLIDNEIADYKASLPIEKINSKRRFASERISINTDLQRAKGDRAQAQAALDIAEEQLAAAKVGFEEQRVLQVALDAAQRERDIRKAAVTSLDEAIASLQADLDEVVQMIEDFEKIEIPEKLLVLEQRLTDKTLVATRGGTVQKIHKLRGIVQLGEPILTLIVTDPEGDDPVKTVRGFVPQGEDPESLELGATVWISVRGANPVAIPSKITSIAPDLSALPNLGTTLPGQFMRGREFGCELPADLRHLLPGTGVQIFRKEPGKFNIWSFGRTPVKSASK